MKTGVPCEEPWRLGGAVETRRDRASGRTNGFLIRKDVSAAQPTPRLATATGGMPHRLDRADRLAVGVARFLRDGESADRETRRIGASSPRSATRANQPHAAGEPPSGRHGKVPDMKYLAVIECPVVFPAENEYALSSVDMLPRLGITAGLESRHMRILDARVTAVCIFTSASAGTGFFDEDWQAKAETLWGDDYRTRFEDIDGAPAA